MYRCPSVTCEHKNSNVNIIKKGCAKDEVTLFFLQLFIV